VTMVQSGRLVKLLECDWGEDDTGEISLSSIPSSAWGCDGALARLGLPPTGD
jgi:hypothetical protein